MSIRSINQGTGGQILSIIAPRPSGPPVDAVDGRSFSPPKKVEGMLPSANVGVLPASIYLESDMLQNVVHASTAGKNVAIPVDRGSPFVNNNTVSPTEVGGVAVNEKASGIK